MENKVFNSSNDFERNTRFVNVQILCGQTVVRKRVYFDKEFFDNSVSSNKIIASELKKSLYDCAEAIYKEIDKKTNL